MITEFWNWMYSSVQNAVGILNTMYNNSTMRPFWDLLIVIAAVGVIMKFILMPLIGFGFAGASDKAQREYDRKDKNKPKDAEYRKV